MGKYFDLECLSSAIMVMHMDMDNYSANSYSRVSESAEGLIATFDSY